MMTGLILTYILFISSAVSYVAPVLLARMDWGSIWLSLPIVFTAFGFQSLIPTLFNYMNRSVSRVRLSLILGTTIPLGIYIIWELLILGIIPYEGRGGLLEAFQNGQSAVAPLGHSTHNQTFLLLGQACAFFAMTTSYWGIAIAFIDFLLDGLRLSRKGIGKALVCAGVFLTPLIITWIDPHLFLNSLRIAGGYGVALLLGAMPVLMVWSGRYYKGHSLLHQQLPGGKITLSILLGFVLFEVLIAISS